MYFMLGFTDNEIVLALNTDKTIIKCILWRNKMDELSKCTIIRVTGRTAYRLETTKELVVGGNVQRNAQNPQKKRLYSKSVKLPIENP